MQTTECKLNEIEADIRPEDFKEGSFWREFVAVYGPGPAIHLINHAGGSRMYILNHDQATKASRLRKRKKDLASV